MKILIYSLNFLPELTATGKYTGELAVWLAEQGHEISAIAGMPHYPQWSLFDEYVPAQYMREQKNGVDILRVPHFIPEKSKVSASNRIKMELSFIRKSFRYWRKILTSKNKYDVVILVCPPLFTAIYPMLYKFFRGVPWVLHVQDIQVDVAVDLGLIENRWLIKSLYFLEKRILRSAASVSTISESMKQKLEKKADLKDEVLLTKNWADSRVLDFETEASLFRDEYGILRDKYLVMYSGNLGKKQGIEIIVDVAGLVSSNADIQIVVVGDGAARDEIVALAGKRSLTNITFLPVQSEVMLPNMLHDADLHLVIQKHEASEIVLPSKLTNILASGKPCIVTAHKGTELEAIVSLNALGVTVEPDNAEALAQAINRRLLDKRGSDEMGKNAGAYARKYLNMDNILYQFEKELESVSSR